MSPRGTNMLISTLRSAMSVLGVLMLGYLRQFGCKTNFLAQIRPLSTGIVNRLLATLVAVNLVFPKNTLILPKIAV